MRPQFPQPTRKLNPWGVPRQVDPETRLNFAAERPQSSLTLGLLRSVIQRVDPTVTPPDPMPDAATSHPRRGLNRRAGRAVLVGGRQIWEERTAYQRMQVHGLEFASAQQLQVRQPPPPCRRE